MPDLSLKEKLQPSLLDRLIDEAPDQSRESRRSRVQSVQALRSAVLRDLEWLLNSENFEVVHDLGSFPAVARSVINYGMPGLAGMTLSSVNVGEIERRLAKAIANFEPRILKESLTVRAVFSGSESSANALTFEILGDLWAVPLPLRMFLRTELDLETGNVKITPLAEH